METPQTENDPIYLPRIDIQLQYEDGRTHLRLDRHFYILTEVRKVFDAFLSEVDAMYELFERETGSIPSLAGVSEEAPTVQQVHALNIPISVGAIEDTREEITVQLETAPEYVAPTAECNSIPPSAPETLRVKRAYTKSSPGKSSKSAIPSTPKTCWTLLH
jgi:hypothetical protein